MTQKIDRQQVLLRVLTESISIIMAVLLALGANQAWDAHQQRTRAIDTTNAIYQEIEDNLAKLKESHAYHESRLLAFQNAVSAGEPAADTVVDSKLYGLGLYRPALVTQTNWDIAKYTNVIPVMSLSELQWFSAIFELQAQYNDFIRKITETDALALLIAADATAETRLATAHLNRIWWYERQLIEAIERTLKGRAQALQSRQ